MSDPVPLEHLRGMCGGLRKVGVAVSGGGDSVAALVLAVEALGAERIAAVTVDHGLRPGSAAEAAAVAELCARLGVGHDTLRWAGPERGNLQDQARRARHRLIADWARGRVDAVILAHTLDDQAETVLMRLARGSGVDGLAGMADRREAKGVRWLRPFLEIRREALREALRERNVPWVEDPSNDDTRFQRVRARRAVAALAELGLDADGLARTARRMRRARRALEWQTAEAMAAHTREERGVIRLDCAVLDLPPEIRDRVFAALLRGLSGDDYPPRLEGLQRLIARRQGALSGCALCETGDGALLLYREAAAVSALEAPASGLWDGRWTAKGGERDGAEVTIRAMGDAGLIQLSTQAARGMHPHWRDTGLPRAALAGLPALWRGGAMIAAPLALWPQGWRLDARPLAAMIPDESQSH